MHKRRSRSDGIFIDSELAKRFPELRRSGLRLEYRCDDRTLREEEVEEIHRRVVNAAAQTFAAHVH